MDFARAHLRSGSDQSRFEAYRCQRANSGYSSAQHVIRAPVLSCSNSTAWAESRPMNIALPMSTFASHIQVPKRTAITFMGTPGAFTSLLLQGSVLQIATAGFYRFWLITDIRRHLWSNTRIGDESLEYSGTARELLVGFVIALAILAPLYLAYFLLGIAAEQLQAFASLPLFIILWVFGHYASFQARCYRATRTVFRGVRFWMSGSASAYAGKALLWDLATILSLGLALPWRIAALERYKMCNTRFGDLPGNFVGTGGALFRRGIGLWGLAASVPVVGCALALAMGGGPRLENHGLRPHRGNRACSMHLRTTDQRETGRPASTWRLPASAPL